MIMNKKLILLASLLIVLQAGWSKPIDRQKAENIAHSFLNYSTASFNSPRKTISTQLELAYACMDYKTAHSASNPYYYVFNRGNNNGFIIISGDDRTKSVLGYSDHGSFNIQNLPDNFKSWLEYYKEQLEAVTQIPDIDIDPYIDNNTPSLGYATAIAPLLGTINYGQDAPYNNLCPIIPSSGEKTVTGCVATAMAQVMRYYKYPSQGTGSHNYTTRTLRLNLSADFGNTTYDWSNMPESYKDYNDAQVQAVATLMLHCGISVNMDYDTTSGAFTEDIPNALISYFGYDSSMQLQYREYFNSTEWKNLIKEELNAKHPVLYEGSSSTGGHQFVCDGYDENDLFHINWGWDGTSNGYFELSILNPHVQGTGGGVGGYNRNQTIVTGIKPAEGKQPASKPMLKLDEGLFYDNQKDSIIFGCSNLGVGNYKGKIGMGIYNEEKLQSATDITSTVNLPTGYGVTGLSYKPENPQNGSIIRPIHQAEGSSTWEPIPAAIGMTSLFKVAVENGKITYKVHSPELPKLTVESMHIIGNLYQGKTGRFEFTVHNTGVEYNYILNLKIQSKDNSTYQTLGREGVVIGTNENKTYQFSGKLDLAPGTYKAYVQYGRRDGYLRNINGNYENENDSYLTIQIKEPSSEKPLLSILSLTVNDNADQIYREDPIAITATIKNEGGYAELSNTLGLYSHSTGKLKQRINHQDVYIDKGETQEIYYKGDISNLAPGKYIAAAMYLDTWSGDPEALFFSPQENNKLILTVTERASSIGKKETTQIVLSPNPATDRINISNEKSIEQVQILNLTGQIVMHLSPAKKNVSVEIDHLPSGTYVLQAQTEDGRSISKFIKR